MDNQTTTESNDSALDINGAAAAFSSFFDEPAKKESAEAQPAEPEQEPVAEDDPQEIEAESATEEQKEDDPLVTVKIDGKDVQVPLSELKNGYQRQADYTRKTMATAEEKREASAARERANQERQVLAENLSKAQAVLETVLTEANQIDWQKLIDENPQEALRQRHLIETRQAQLQQIMQQRHQLAQASQAEMQEHQRQQLNEQREHLLAKLPSWRNEATQKAERDALRNYLVEFGYDPQSVDSVADHRAVLLGYKAMQYDRLMSKANAATKKVQALPKVEKPGSGARDPSLDRRSSDFQRLQKSGSIDDAARVFHSFL